MWKATAGSLALRPELLPCAPLSQRLMSLRLKIPSHDGHPALGYITQLAFDYERTLTSKLMLLHGTQRKGDRAIAFC